jgi:trimethylamine:corrinoid methyltransferase-like protein
MATKLKLELLSKEEVANMYDKCLHLLSTKGERVEHEEALKLLDKAGAQVDFGKQIVKYPADMVEEAIRKAPKSFPMAGQIEENDFIIPDPNGLFYTRTSTGAPQYAEPESTKYHPTTLADVAEWGQLTSLLEDMNCCTFPSPQDVPGETADIHALKVLFENTTKHIVTQPYSLKAIKYLYELAIVAAGSEEAYRKRPIMSMLACTLPPFTFPDLYAEVVIYASRLGVPFFPNPMTVAGAAAPITIPGTVLQGGTEIMGKITMSYLLNPKGVPAIPHLGVFTLDMITGRTLRSSIESIMAAAASAQFVTEAIHVPSCTHGFSTDSYISDGQAVMDVMLRNLMVVLAGADMLVNAGHIANGIAASPVQLIIDNKITTISKRIKAGLKVDDDTLAWQEILDTEPGGHYLELAHTLKHCREALRTGLSVTQPRDTWMAEGSKDLLTRMVEEYHDMKKKLQPRELPSEVKREMERIVKKADEELAK